VLGERRSQRALALMRSRRPSAARPGWRSDTVVNMGQKKKVLVVFASW
jgi:hypothetical protein